MKSILFLCFLLVASAVGAQGYTDSLRKYRSNYIKTHEVVKGTSVANLQFFPVKPEFRVPASFEKTENAPWISFQTTGSKNKVYRVYGVISFNLEGAVHKLNIYQSQDLLNTNYSSYLFLPFTDASNGNGTYVTGRYIDLKMEDISEGTVMIDFNKAYNPYCAYVDDMYNCPIPPQENNLAIAITAGEKDFIRE